MDFEYNLRLLAAGELPTEVARVLSRARLHPASKTVSEGSRAFIREDLDIVKRFFHAIPVEERAGVQRRIESMR